MVRLSELDVMPTTPCLLEGHVEEETDELHLVLTGSAETPDRPNLSRLLRGLHDRAREMEARRVEVDLTQLKFMNSSCFKDFVTWLSQVQALPKESQYRIHFISNPQSRWQRASLLALSSFAASLVNIS